MIYKVMKNQCLSPRWVNSEESQWDTFRKADISADDQERGVRRDRL